MSTHKCDAELMVTRMSRQMRAEMAANDFKGNDWCEMEPEGHEFELVYHVLKLIYSSRAKDKAGILEHAADTANCAGMMADSCRVWPSGHLTPTGNSCDYAEGTSNVRTLATKLRDCIPTGPMFDHEKNGAAA